MVPGERLHLRLDYDPARFTPETAESIAARLVKLLEAAVAVAEGRCTGWMSSTPTSGGCCWKSSMPRYRRFRSDPACAVRAAGGPDAGGGGRRVRGRAVTYGELNARPTAWRST